jgi:hypothetical protein
VAYPGIQLFEVAQNFGLFNSSQAAFREIYRGSVLLNGEIEQSPTRILEYGLHSVEFNGRKAEFLIN